MKRHVDAIVREALNDAIQGGRLRTRSIPAFSVDVPRHAAFGDLACDVALVLGRQLGKSPHAIGAAIAGCVRDPHGWLAEVGIGGPGFVNFRFAPPFWGAVLTEAIAAGAAYGRSDAAQGQRVRVELVADGPADATSARGAALADALTELLRASGADVERGLAESSDARPVQVVGVVSGSPDATVRLLEHALRDRAAGQRTALRILTVQPVRVTRDGSPVPDAPSADALLREIGPDALRFLLLRERAERPVDLDLELARQERTDNPLFLVQYAHARLVARGADAGGVGEVDATVLAASDLEVLRALASWPDVVEAASRGLEPDRLVRHAIEMAGATHRWLNRHRPDDAAGGRARTRAVLAACLARVFRRTLALCNVSAPERM
jgi:arginyl-tRNA synthetase